MESIIWKNSEQKSLKTKPLLKIKASYLNNDLCWKAVQSHHVCCLKHITLIFSGFQVILQIGISRTFAEKQTVL